MFIAPLDYDGLRREGGPSQDIAIEDPAGQLERGLCDELYERRMDLTGSRRATNPR